MRSKIAKRILAETPEHVKVRVRKYVELIINKKA